MLFNSYIFIFAFLPATFLIYAALKRTRFAAAPLAWLAATSLFFYGFFVPRYVVLLLISVLVNYSLGQCIKSYKDGSGARRAVLTFGIIFNLGLLGYFKYFNFILDNLAYLGLERNWPQIVLPIAISFFTFQQIAYLADTYANKTDDSNFLNYCVFVFFFPQLIAGPIVHHSEMMPQFAREAHRSVRISNISVGLTIFFAGLFKKVVIADGIAVYASPVFAAADGGAGVTTFEAWGAALAYTFQLYYDFSGYSDMAIGLARLFGIRLPLNFFSPYKATSIIEFWRRWHMTLSRFLRDYLYIPLGGGRRGEPRRFVNLMLTMVIGGLWHGAGWNFLIWGGLHGIYLVINHGWRRCFPAARLIGWLRRCYTVLALLLTFFAVVVGWVFFRATTIDGAFIMVAAMFGVGGVTLPADTENLLGSYADILTAAGIVFTGENVIALRQWATAVPALALLLIFTWSAPNTQQLMRRYRPTVDQIYWDTRAAGAGLIWRPKLGWAIVTAIMAVTGIAYLSRATEFLYFQF
jgi:D-alanyl-lipoteichoic acid acyltransferase DltB (MBOAT superfamily)